MTSVIGYILAEHSPCLNDGTFFSDTSVEGAGISPATDREGKGQTGGGGVKRGEKTEGKKGRIRAKEVKKGSEDGKI